MEVKRSDFSNKKSLAMCLFYEFAGSALISYAFNLTDGSAYGRAAAYAVGYLVAYNISGGHFNPATTLAVMLVQNNV